MQSSFRPLMPIFYTLVSLFQMTYSIVHFTESDEVAVVCTKWITQPQSCVWPMDVSRSTLQKMLQLEADPQTNWMRYEVRILCSNISTFHDKWAS